MKFYCIKNCSTCKKARAWLEKNKVSVEEIDLKKEAPSKKELLSALSKSELEPRRFFNTSGQVYRELNLKEQAASLSEEEVATLLSQHPMLIKRPLLITKDKVLVGFREEEYETLID